MAWNVRQPSALKCGRIAEAVATLAPDVAFFSEWSPVPERGASRLAGELARHGFGHAVQVHWSDFPDDGRAWARAHWGVLSASNRPLDQHHADYPLISPAGWLEVMEPSTGLTLVGLRVMSWNDARQVEYWEWIVAQCERLADRPALVLGDFNVDREQGGSALNRNGQALLDRLEQQLGWRDVHAMVGAVPVATFHRNSGKTARLDHAFVSPAFSGKITNVSVPYAAGVVRLFGPARDGAGSKVDRLSDHGPLVVDLELGDAEATGWR